MAIAHLDLGVIYQGQGRRQDALRELKTAERLSPDDPSIHWRLGRFYQSVGRTAEAKAEFDQTRDMLQGEGTISSRANGTKSKPSRLRQNVNSEPR